MQLGKRMYAAYPGSELLDLGPRQLIAMFEFERHAEDFVKRLWPGIGYVEPIEVEVQDCYAKSAR